MGEVGLDSAGWASSIELWPTAAVGVAMELDHVIVFVNGPEAAASLFPGFVLEPGIRHTGQGTRNRRVVFPGSYVEVLWIDDPDARQRSRLGGASRFPPGAPCPFGVVYGGRSVSRTGSGLCPTRCPRAGRRCCCSTPRCTTRGNPSSRFARTGAHLNGRRSRNTRAAPERSDVFDYAAQPSPTLVRCLHVMSSSSRGGRGFAWSGKGQRPHGSLPAEALPCVHCGLPLKPQPHRYKPWKHSTADEGGLCAEASRSVVLPST